MTAYDPADPDQVAERQEDRTRRQQQEEADWRWMLGAPQGRRLLAWLIEQSGWLGSSASENPLRAAYLEGRRSVAIDLNSRITAAGESASLTALLAEVMLPDVGNRDARRRRDPARR